MCMFVSCVCVGIGGKGGFMYVDVSIMGVGICVSMCVCVWVCVRVCVAYEGLRVCGCLYQMGMGVCVCVRVWMWVGGCAYVGVIITVGTWIQCTSVSLSKFFTGSYLTNYGVWFFVCLLSLVLVLFVCFFTLLLSILLSLSFIHLIDSLSLSNSES